MKNKNDYSYESLIQARVFTYIKHKQTKIRVLANKQEDMFCYP